MARRRRCRSEGKAVLIAFALSIIERILFPERPVFYVTAGQRGGGKTTALIMVTLAALGIKPAAMAWTGDADERKKAIFAVLREGAPSLMWDNIPRGAVIGCPHVERASTTTLYKDRALGESKPPTAPAFTIMGFTGNNIRPKSDTASRSLIARLNVDGPDPENREFVHSDPIAWTLDHRGEILNGLYMVLLGNPQLDPDCRRATQTRFKTWWRLVGSAVEHAVETTGGYLSFKKLFERVEADDEDAVARADILHTLYGIPTSEDRTFTTATLFAYLTDVAERTQNGVSEEPSIAELRRFCTARSAKNVSLKSITIALKSIEGTPVNVPAGILTLHVWKDPTTKATTFKVELKPGVKDTA